jgi:hypothetical protein
MLVVRLDNKSRRFRKKFKWVAGRTSRHLEKRNGRPERQHRVRGRSSRRRPREFVFEGEAVFPDCPRPANGDAGSKAVCSVGLRNAIDVCVAAIVVARADSCPPSLADVVTVKCREDSQRILRELIVSLERIIVRIETPRGVQVDP